VTAKVHSGLHRQQTSWDCPHFTPHHVEELHPNPVSHRASGFLALAIDTRNHHRAQGL